MVYIEIAKAIKPQGIKGEIKLQHFCDKSSDFAFDRIYKKELKSYVPIEVQNIRYDANNVFVKLEGVLSRDDAEKFRGIIFYVEKENIKNLPSDVYMIRDLIGIEIVGDDGKALGKLKDILQHGSADVYVVKSEKNDFMFPALKHVIKNVDIDNKRMTVYSEKLSEVAVYED